jgi:hypothetical protein
MQIEDGHPPANRKKKINLTEQERKRIIAQLMIGCICVDGLPKLDRKAISRVAKDFDKNVCTVRRLWNRAKQNFSQFGKLTSTLRKSIGRPRVYDPLEVARALEKVPTQKRRSIRSLSAALGISSTAVYKLKTGKGYDLQVI